MKNTNSKTYWLIFMGIAIVLLGIACILLVNREIANAPSSNGNSNNTANLPAAISPNSNEQKPLANIISQYGEAISINPSNIDNYIQKSEVEYQIGDTEAALRTINDGLKVDPKNDLLLSRKDVLENSFISNENIDNPKGQ